MQCSPLTAVSLFCVSAILLFTNVKYLKREEPAIQYSYLSDDFPQVWYIGELDKVNMVVDDTHHYAFDDELADAQWSALLPGGDGIIRLGPQGREFSFSMVHQLRCLDIIRRALIDGASYDSEKDERGQIRHCINYLRQMLLCRSDIHLENVRRASNTKPGNVPIRSMRQCYDWEKVYRAVRRNKETWSQR